jgi:cobalamin biosynthesis protein CobC
VAASDPKPRDHGGGIDAAAARHGGTRADWLDLSTGINPVPYPVGPIAAAAWTDLPDAAAAAALKAAARAFWQVPDGAGVVAAAGASALIAAIPLLTAAGTVRIAQPTYNEHEAAFRAAGWAVAQADPAQARVFVHPNNPDGRFFTPEPGGLLVIDESFCDVTPVRSLIDLAAQPGVLILKSFGKFWGLAGLRLGFAIGDPALVAQLAEMLGPWRVSGPALAIGAQALADQDWAAATRARLLLDAARLDRMVGAPLVGGTGLFRLYDVPDAAHWQQVLATHWIWSRTFPYNPRWLRLGLPGTPAGWARLALALHDLRGGV